MKKVVIIIFIILLLAGIGVGGYFLYTNVISDMLTGGGSPVDEDGNYYISKDPRFKEVMKALKDEVGKDEITLVSESLDYAVASVLDYVPEYDRETLIQQLVMDDMYSVKIAGLDIVYGLSTSEQVIVNYIDLYYEPDQEGIDCINFIFGTEETEYEESVEETIEETTSYVMPASDIFSDSMIADINYMLQHGESFEYKSVSEVCEELFDEEVEDRESKISTVVSYLSDMDISMSDYNAGTVGCYLDNGVLYYVVDYGGSRMSVFDINANGDTNDFTQVLEYLNEQAPANWRDYDFSMGNGSTVTNDSTDSSNDLLTESEMQNVDQNETTISQEQSMDGIQQETESAPAGSDANADDF